MCGCDSCQFVLTGGNYSSSLQPTFTFVVVEECQKISFVATLEPFLTFEFASCLSSPPPPPPPPPKNTFLSALSTQAQTLVFTVLLRNIKNKVRGYVGTTLLTF